MNVPCVCECVKGMQRAVLSIKIRGQEDMARLEQTIGVLLGGENHKCSLMRSKDFVSLRLRALYNRPAILPREGLLVYGEGLKITLDDQNNAAVYLTVPSIDQDESVLGKRACPETGVSSAPSVSDADPWPARKHAEPLY